MKWYSFIKVCLWFSIIANVISAFMYFAGSIYQGFADSVYRMLPALRAWDIFSGFFSLAMAVFAFGVWRSLHGYEAKGPKLLTALYIVNIVFLIVSTIATSSVIGSAENMIIYGDKYTQGIYEYQEYLDLSALRYQPSQILSILISIVYTIINHFYFKERSRYFIN